MYAEKFYKAGDSVKLFGTDTLPSISEKPAMLLPDGTVVEMPESSINNYERAAEGYLVYTLNYNDIQTPPGTEFVEITVVNNVVVNIGEKNARTEIPSNGYIVSLNGPTAADVSKFSIGDIVLLNMIDAPIYPEVYCKHNGYVIGIDAVNKARDREGMACVYTNTNKTPTTQTNIWGWEVVVSNNIVTKVVEKDTEGVSGNSEIPSDGFVLSVHGTHATFATEFPNIKVGDRIEFSEKPFKYVATTYDIAAVDPAKAEDNPAAADAQGFRGVDQAVMYTKEGSNTGTGTGAEISVVNNAATAFSNAGNSQVPSGGYVLSIGNELAKTYSKYFKAGITVKYNSNLNKAALILVK
jgi:hypothetical protein